MTTRKSSQIGRAVWNRSELVSLTKFGSPSEWRSSLALKQGNLANDRFQTAPVPLIWKISDTLNILKGTWTHHVSLTMSTILFFFNIELKRDTQAWQRHCRVEIMNAQHSSESWPWTFYGSHEWHSHDTRVSVERNEIPQVQVDFLNSSSLSVCLRVSIDNKNSGDLPKSIDWVSIPFRLVDHASSLPSNVQVYKKSLTSCIETP